MLAHARRVDGALIELTAISKRYRSWRGWRPWRRAAPVEALAGVDLRVERGEVLGVVGLNGAGKTTLLKILATLVAPDEGRGTVLGHALGARRASGAVRAAIGLVVADERSFYWRLTGRHNLQFFGALHGLGPAAVAARVDALAPALDLSPTVLDRAVRTYSSGMRKKLALLRALLHEPQVLLCDEATRGLDPAASQRLRRLIRERLVGRQGVTIVWATHDLAELPLICDRVVLLHRGRVLGCGPTSEQAAPVAAHFERHAAQEAAEEQQDQDQDQDQDAAGIRVAADAARLEEVEQDGRAPVGRGATAAAEGGEGTPGRGVER